MTNKTTALSERLDAIERRQGERPVRKLAEEISMLMAKVAAHENQRVSRYDTAIYQGIQRALVEAIQIGWCLGPQDAARVRDLIADNGEDVAYNVGLVRNMDA